MSKRISVIGSSDCTQAEYNAALEVGREIGLRKGILICGGLGGVMEAAAKGAKEAGAMTVGILPGTETQKANPFIDIPIATGLGEARNLMVALSPDAIIAVGGALGTLSELAFALKYKKPVVGLKTWKLDKDYCDKINIIDSSSAKDAVDKAFSLIR